MIMLWHEATAMSLKLNSIFLRSLAMKVEPTERCQAYVEDSSKMLLTKLGML